MQNIILSTRNIDDLISDVANEVVRKMTDWNLASSVKTPQIDNEPKLLTRKETAELLGVSLVTLNEWTRTNKIPSIKIGTRVRYEIAEVFRTIKKG
jgi:excisionase family DNA binding protein